MKQRKTYPLYRIIRWLVWLFYPKMRVVGAENLPEDAAVIAGNHTQMNGPISCELYYPRKKAIWCAGQMMHLKEVPAYAYADFWSGKPKAVRWFYKALSYLIAPLSVVIFNNADTLPVYRDSRIIGTFRASVAKLQEGTDLVIFPEYDKRYNNILYAFQDKFVDVARLYHKRTGRELSFVPLYIAPKLKTAVIGKPTRFRADAPIEEERQRICRYLTEEITRMACSLPLHTVIPYRNIRKRDYPKNLPLEVYDEKKDG